LAARLDGISRNGDEGPFPAGPEGDDFYAL